MEDRKLLYNSAIKAAIITTVLYVTVKQAVYMIFFDSVYWLPRGIAGLGLLIAVFLIASQKFSRRQLSWMIPLAWIVAESAVIPFVEYDRLIYFYMIGCALLSLLFINVLGLLITIVASWVSMSIFLFVFNYSLMGKDCFADDIFYFIGVVVVHIIIFLMGKYSIGALEKSRNELEAAYQHTKEHAKMKSDLFTAISHEMRSPLTVMATYAQYVAEQIKKNGAVADRTIADLDIISGEAKRLAEMADGTLEMLMTSSTQNGLNGGKHKSAPIDICRLTKRIAKLLEPVAERKNVKLTVDISDNLPPVTGDADTLMQLLWNILQNALTHSNGKSVEFYAEAVGESVTIIVKDDGHGIPLDLLPRVFERGVSGTAYGSGIGLPVCREIARRHGGEIAIESVPDKGTCVTVSLPFTGGKKANG